MFNKSLCIVSIFIYLHPPMPISEADDGEGTAYRQAANENLEGSFRTEYSATFHAETSVNYECEVEVFARSQLSHLGFFIAQYLNLLLLGLGKRLKSRNEGSHAGYLRRLLVARAVEERLHHVLRAPVDAEVTLALVAIDLHA